MPSVNVNGIELYYESHGSGRAVILCHELAGDMRTWHSLVGHLARRYRVITFNYRGYPPTSVPSTEADYSHDTMVENLRQFMVALGIGDADLVGHGTGGNLVLSFAFAHPGLVRSLVMAGSGAGSMRGREREAWLAASAAFAQIIETDGIAALKASILTAPQRQAFARKDPEGWAAFLADIPSLSATGISLLIRNAIMNRPSLYDVEDEIRRLPMPVLVAVGDQDTPAYQASLYVGATAPFAGVTVLPDCGHTLILEEPQLFNALVGDFLARVDNGRWANWKA